MRTPTAEEIAQFKAMLESRVAEKVASVQSNIDWLKEQTGAVLDRSERGLVHARLLSPITGREVIVQDFQLASAADRVFVETLAANWIPRQLSAYAEDYFEQQLLSSIRL